ncbi:trypsin-like serine protease [Ramicandelaber brevisporus]|nr:trypsin-like serine protease [Ramicandelaber brevisporus]
MVRVSLLVSVSLAALVAHASANAALEQPHNRYVAPRPYLGFNHGSKFHRTHAATTPVAKTTNSDVHPRIVGGSAAKDADFPWLGRLTVVQNNMEQNCAAVLISNRHFLTAAQCVHSTNGTRVRTTDISIAMGTASTNQTNAAIVARVDRVDVPSMFSFTGPSSLSDIAILWAIPETMQPVNSDSSSPSNSPATPTASSAASSVSSSHSASSSSAVPSAAPTNMPNVALHRGRAEDRLSSQFRPTPIKIAVDRIGDRQSVTIAGWGATSFDAPSGQSDTLMRAKVRTGTAEACQMRDPDFSDNNGPYVCTGPGAPGPCGGDASSPIVINSGGMDLLVGLATFYSVEKGAPQKCDHPTAYHFFTHISRYLGYISKTTGIKTENLVVQQQQPADDGGSGSSKNDTVANKDGGRSPSDSATKHWSASQVELIFSTVVISCLATFLSS